MPLKYGIGAAVTEPELKLVSVFFFWSECQRLLLFLIERKAFQTTKMPMLGILVKIDLDSVCLCSR